MKANLYKIEDVSNYKSILEEMEYENIAFFRKEGIKFELWLLSKEHNPTDWKIILKNKFELDNKLNETQKNKYNFDKGTVDLRALVVISKDSNVFTVSYGKGSFDIKDFIDPDFGLDFAERALSRETIDKQTVDFFQKSKMRELTNYRNKNSSIISATESVSYISGSPLDIERYGNRIECGMSVIFNISSANYFGDLSELVNNIIELMNNPDRQNYSLPRIKRLPKRDHLNMELFDKVFNEIKQEDFKNVDIISIYEKDGNFYNLSAFNTVKSRIRNNSKTIKELEDYSFNSINKYVNEMTEDEISFKLEEINLIFSGDELGELEISLVEVLYAFIISNNRNYALQNGYWGEYNQEYLNKLNETLDRIPISIENNPSRHKKASEDTYIIDNSNLELLNIHKQFVKPNNDYSGRKIGIEVGDLYNANNDEVHVIKKGGDTNNSLYSIEQAILSIHVLRNLSDFDTAGLELEINQLNNVKKIIIKWLYFTDYEGKNSYYVNDKGHRLNQQIINKILNHSNEEFRLKENINSILLKNKIVEWYLTCLEYNYVSEIVFETPMVNR